MFFRPLSPKSSPGPAAHRSAFPLETKPTCPATYERYPGYEQVSSPPGSVDRSYSSRLGFKYIFQLRQRTADKAPCPHDKSIVVFVAKNDLFPLPARLPSTLPPNGTLPLELILFMPGAGTNLALLSEPGQDHGHR